jgi:predicted CXXCH cytochrome family protein
LDNDDSLLNHLCRNCHNDLVAPFVRTHSSLTTDQGYGSWTFECRICHNPHNQEQKITYGSSSYLFQGTISSLSDNVLGCTGAGWTDNQFQNMVVYPNVTQWPNQSYKVLRNSADTLSVDGPMDTTRTATGRTFAVINGRLVKGTVSTPYNGKTGVKYFRDLGTNSFSDGDATYDGICEVCHTATVHYRNDGSPDHSHRQGTTKCTVCHRHIRGFKISGGGAHAAHDGLVSCDDGNLGCHGANDPPLLADGQSLATTTKCNNCHTTTGAGTAKSYWNSYGTSGSWISVAGEVSFCVSCHNSSPGYTQMNGGGDSAPDIRGNNSTYGYGVTGHGKSSGNYPRLSWQATTATGNPAANRLCSVCHDLNMGHFNTSGKRLRAGFENDNTNTNCRHCHDPGTAAVAAPPWYTSYSAFQASAHGAVKCTECHDAHGKAGAYAGMAKGNKQNLCLTCHTGMSGHALGVSFGRGGSSYSLECVTCHNVHVVTGMYSAADTTKTPLTRIDNNLVLWGGASGQKMVDFAGSGTYRTPEGDTLTGAQLPDYPTFCLQCHGQSMSPSIHGNISWGEMHGTGAAGPPSDGGYTPDWYGTGKAKGWDGDDCIGGDNACWPVIPRGAGEILWTQDSYVQTERIANINFVLSCSDCHVTHESGIGRKIRSTVNGNPGSTSYNTMCNACHWYYGVTHAGMSCGNAGCHNSGCSNNRGDAFCNYNTLHGQSRAGSGGGSRIFDNSLVVDMRFEGNLNDSGSWRLHSKWFSDSTNYPTIVAGSFVAGKSGQAVSLSGNSIIQVGTRNGYWSTDEGYHGTWKYTEMKYDTTLETWVYPTDNAASEMSIFSKHVGVNDGGYQFLLKKINGPLRVVFNMQADNNGFAQGGKAGLRGAYSSLSIPLNKWTHVAATFDRNGPDRNPTDPSVGRIRIYVNGIDVTTSDATGNNMQPGAGETSIYAYSENSPWNQGICYNGSWCAGEFAVGGFPWQNRFTGSLDEAKVWNVTKGSAYFAAYEGQAGPYISTASGIPGSNQLTVIFSEGVYTNSNMTGALVPADFVLTDADNGRTITGVTHTAGSASATLTLSSPLDSSNDIGVDTLGAASNAVFDKNGNAAGTENVVIGASLDCPTSPVTIDLNEPSGSTIVKDTQNKLYGSVNNPSSTIPGDGYFHGNGSSANYIDFNYNTSCLLASTAMTLETRIKPQGLSGVTGNYISRIFERNAGTANYQITVWRTLGSATFPNFTPPTGVASIALWVAPVDAHGGNAWKPVLTNYALCPIVNDHWYDVRAIWNTGKSGGTTGQYFVPAEIWVEDQGTNGAYNDNQWAGSRDCTNSSQSYQVDASKLWTGDVIATGTGAITIGATITHSNMFNGLIDVITWSDSAGSPQGAAVRWDWDMDLYIVPPSP